MRNALRGIVTAAIVLAFAAVPASAADALTLDDYFAAALKRSEVVATQVELIRQAEERYQQARATIFPAVNGIVGYTQQEATPAGSLPTSSIANRQSQVRLNVTQPLFRGFREFAGLRQTQALIGAQSQDYFNAQIQLFRDVAQNFYTILSTEQDLRNLEEEIVQNQKREAELNSRVRIGRSRTSEVLTVQSTISTLRAQVEQLQAQLRAAREAFAFLSGLDAGTPLNDVETLPAEVEPLSDYLGNIDERPDLRASQQRLAAADENVAIARGARLPSVDLTGNYYLARSGGLIGDVSWDVQLALTVPLYAGGGLESRVRESLSQRTQAELALNQLRRQAEQQIRSAYDNTVYDRAQLAALECATDTARRNYEVQSREYRLGLVTNLDVLQALTTYLENQRALDRARFTAKLNYLTLQAASVRRPVLQGDAR